MGIYQGLYNLLELYIYGGNIVEGSHMDLICVLLSSMGCVFLVSLPFLVVWKLIKLVVGGF